MKSKKIVFWVLLAIIIIACIPKKKTVRPQSAKAGGGGGSNNVAPPVVVPPVVIPPVVVPPNNAAEIFNYYGNDTGMMVDFSSHSIVSKPVNIVGGDVGNANSFCEYSVYNASGVLVVYCKNTRSGLHPNYSNTFNHNNHLPQFSKRLPPGTYTLVYKNISTEPVAQELLFGIISNNGNDQINENVASGQTVNRTFNIYNDSNSHFKLNNNVYQ